PESGSRAVAWHDPEDVPMDARPATHPSADTLLAFGQGKLEDAAAAAAVMSHLAACADCYREVAALSGDSFLDRVRAARAQGTTPAPAKALSGAVPPSARAPRPAPAAPPSDVPLELAGNPQYEIVRELGRG